MLEHFLFHYVESPALPHFQAARQHLDNAIDDLHSMSGDPGGEAADSIVDAVE